MISDNKINEETVSTVNSGVSWLSIQIILEQAEVL